MVHFKAKTNDPYFLKCAVTRGPPGDAPDILNPACLLLYVWLGPTWGSPLHISKKERTVPRWHEPHVENQAGGADEVMCVAWRAISHSAFQEGRIVSLGFEMRRCEVLSSV